MALQPPEIFQCQPGPRRIACTWAPPQQKGVAIAYSYRLYIKKSSEPTFAKTFEGKDVFEHTVRGLEANTEYNVRLMAFTANRADGPCAPVATVRTSIAGPSLAPTDLHAIFTGLDTLEVAWELPETKDVVTGQRLFMDEEGHEHFVEVDLLPAARTFRATYLKLDTVYRFQLLAFNDAGEGPLTDIVRIRTQQDPVSRFLQKDRRPEQIVSLPKLLDIRGEAAPRSAPAPEPEPEPEKPKFKPSAPFVPSCERKGKGPFAPPPRAGAAAAAAAAEPEPEPELSVDHAAEARAAATEERRRKRELMNSMVDDLVLKAQATLNAKKVFVADPPVPVAVVSKGVSEAPVSASQQALAERAKGRRDLEQQMASREGDPLLPFINDDKLLKTLTGTIRGKKNAVRSALKTLQAQKQFDSEVLERVYNEEKDGKIVIYVTSVKAVRKTSDDCRTVLKMFEALNKKVQIKDINLDPRFTVELQERRRDCSVPQVFVNSMYIGDLAAVSELNESGDLGRMLAGFADRSAIACRTCGGAGFYNCTWCQGSKRSTTHGFGKDTREMSLKCTVCNEIGLERCPDC